MTSNIPLVLAICRSVFGPAPDASSAAIPVAPPSLSYWSSSSHRSYSSPLGPTPDASSEAIPLAPPSLSYWSYSSHRSYSSPLGPAPDASSAARQVGPCTLARALVLVFALVFAVTDLPAAEPAAQPPSTWIEREKIRAGWIYHSDGIEQIARFKAQGLNALVTSAGSPEAFDKWAAESRRAGMHLFGVLNFSFNAQKAGLRRAVFGNGYESVVACPTDETFWQQQLIAKAVQLAKDGMSAEKEISGILIDFELYANSAAGQIYYTDACYCDHCLGAFLKHKGLDDISKQVPFADRIKWLRDKNLFEEYHPFLQSQVRALAAKMREAVEAVRKDFFLGFYPKPHNWMLVGVAQGLGSPDHPMILWATDTYGGGGPNKVPDQWREDLQKQDIHACYCAGMLLRMYSAANLAANMYFASLKGNGYWLFTVHTLCIPEDAQSGDYYLSAGAPDEYLAAIRRANSELDKLCADPTTRPLSPSSRSLSATGMSAMT